MIGIVDKSMDKAARAILSGEIKSTDFALSTDQVDLSSAEKAEISMAWAKARKIERSL